MKNFGVSKAFAVFFALFMGFACEKPQVENISKPQASDEITVENGILKFPDQKKFNETIEFLRGKNENVTEWYGKVAKLGFHSNKQGFDAITEQDYEAMAQKAQIFDQFENYLTFTERNGETEVREVVSGPLAHVVNKNNEVIIGDDKLRFSYTELDLIRNYQSQSLIKTERILAKSISSNSKAKSIKDTEKNHYYYDGNAYKKVCAQINSEVFTSNGVQYYGDIEVCSRHYRRLFGIWWLVDTDALAITAGLAGVGPLTLANNCTECSVVSKSLSTEGYVDPLWGLQLTNKYYKLIQSVHTATLDTGSAMNPNLELQETI